MSVPVDPAYSSKQWFWAVNLIAVLGTIGFFTPVIFTSPTRVASILPFAFIVSFIISWLLIAPLLKVAMRKPASWLRSAIWGTASAMLVASVGFVLAEIRRFNALSSDGEKYQLGGGEYVREINGVVTSYGWQAIIQSNVTFILLGLVIALIIRAIIGPGRPTP